MQLARIAALVARRNAGGASLRDLADDIGISKSAVDAYVGAAKGLRDLPKPHKTRDRLTKWYLREKLVDEGGLQNPVDMALVALEMLAGVPEASRRAALAQLVATLGEIYDRTGGFRPAWLDELARSAADPADSPPADKVASAVSHPLARLS